MAVPELVDDVIDDPVSGPISSKHSFAWQTKEIIQLNSFALKFILTNDKYSPIDPSFDGIQINHFGMPILHMVIYAPYNMLHIICTI